MKEQKWVHQIPFKQNEGESKELKEYFESNIYKNQIRDIFKKCFCKKNKLPKDYFIKMKSNV
jgi:hypothetical protein